MFFTGLRIGEMCALKWRDISLEEKIISVRQTMQRIQTPGNSGRKIKILVSSPKSISSIRKIPIPSPMFDLLKKFNWLSIFQRTLFF